MREAPLPLQSEFETIGPFLAWTAAGIVGPRFDDIDAEDTVFDRCGLYLCAILKCKGAYMLEGAAALRYYRDIGKYPRTAAVIVERDDIFGFAVTIEIAFCEHLAKGEALYGVAPTILTVVESVALLANGIGHVFQRCTSTAAAASGCRKFAVRFEIEELLFGFANAFFRGADNGDLLAVTHL